MKALPVQPQPLWRTDFRQRIAVSLWFVPTIYAAAAIVAANLTIWLDARVDAPIGVRPGLISDPGSAATFAAAIAAATLAFVAVVFATTLVAIQLAASQYSPRTVRIFIRSRVTRVTLGLFLATFVFSVIILVSNRASIPAARQFAPVVSVSTLLALTVGVGEYLAHGTPIALVHGGKLDDRDVTRFFLIGGERTFVQDPAFGFRQLVDVACRALSPAVNDPMTGVQAIDRISDLLAITGSRPDPTGLRVDASGTVRVKRKLRNFDALLVLALTEVIRYGADAPQVVRRLHGLLNELESTLPAERHAAIAGQRNLLEAAVSEALPAAFASVASAADREGLG